MPKRRIARFGHRSCQRLGSAGFQPAVSPASSRPARHDDEGAAISEGRRVGNPRDSRLEVCATVRQLAGTRWVAPAGRLPYCGLPIRMAPGCPGGWPTLGSAGFQPAGSQAARSRRCEAADISGARAGLPPHGGSYRLSELCAFDEPMLVRSPAFRRHRRFEPAKAGTTNARFLAPRRDRESWQLAMNTRAGNLRYGPAACRHPVGSANRKRASKNG